MSQEDESDALATAVMACAALYVVWRSLSSVW
jgi:hypothetical protein